MEDIRQSGDWGKYLETQEAKMIDIPAEDGVHVIKGILMPLRMLGLTMLKVQRAEYDPDWVELKKIKREFRVASSIIEPARVQDGLGYAMAGYKLSHFPYLATKTVVVDLTPKKETLWKNLAENARRLIKKNEGVKIVEVTPEVFRTDWKKWAKIWTMKESELVTMKGILGNKVRFLESVDDNGAHSGLLIVRTRDTANYMHSWTSELGRKSGAHFKMVWEELLESKKVGCKYFDFEGIYDERWPQKKWLGFTEFKKKFGGKVISFPGCYFRWL